MIYAALNLFFFFEVRKNKLNLHHFISGNSSVGRARPCQGRGRGFESRFPLFFICKQINISPYQNLRINKNSARVAELVDALDLKSSGLKRPCGFKSRSGYKKTFNAFALKVFFKKLLAATQISDIMNKH